MNAAEQLAERVGVQRACETLGVSHPSLYHRRRGAPNTPPARPRPPLALSIEDARAHHGGTAFGAFRRPAPRAVSATLLEEGTYLASVRTLYRLLEQAGESGERRAQRRHPSYAKPELLATAPNQLWSWDIERHEALSDRAAVRDRRGSAVAAAEYKLRAA